MRLRRMVYSNSTNWGKKELMNIIEINRRRTFSLLEAQQLLPIVWRMTQQASRRVTELTSRVEAIRGHHDERVTALETEISELIQSWQDKLEKLGVHTKGLWIADFDSGDGYYCWKFPEDTLQFWHRYSDGFTGRQPIMTPPLENAHAASTETNLDL